MKKKYNNYFKNIKSENTKKSLEVILKKLDNYLIHSGIENIEKMQDFEVDIFLKREYSGKSETTISNTISRLKHLFNFYNNENATSHLSLKYFKELTDLKKEHYFTPSEIYNIIENLLNFQDKALVLLTYLGFYDNNFDTIRNLKKTQLKKNMLYINNTNFITLNPYCETILKQAILESEMRKYSFIPNRKSSPFPLNDHTPYIFKSKLRKGCAPILPAVTLKKRFDLFGKFLNLDNFSPIVIKNSKFIYDLVKLELKENLGMNINQIELKNYCRENNMIGQVEKLNIHKKNIKLDIINDIITHKDFFIN